MQGKKLYASENIRLKNEGQTPIFKISNMITSKAQTALVSAVSKLFSSMNSSTCTKDSFSNKYLLSGYHVLTVASNITMKISGKLPALRGHTFCWGRLRKSEINVSCVRWNCVCSGGG